MSASDRSVPGEGGASPAKSKKAPPEIFVRVSWCKGCGLCVDYCPRGVIKMENGVPAVVEAEKCTRCLQCEAICPDFAIEIRDAEKGA
ncbi:MAG TPA: 4Fe-4S binding protein [Acidobacteriota bacterium]|nr:4Fe-4S binding protein [bacterium]HNX19682.1 4Fe-4S binding protein [Acidobacteriota bacterium]